jgi:hypothetical protein
VCLPACWPIAKLVYLNQTDFTEGWVVKRPNSISQQNIILTARVKFDVWYPIVLSVLTKNASVP